MEKFNISQVLDLPQFLPLSTEKVWWTLVH